MTIFDNAISKLTKTKKGNYKKESVEALIHSLIKLMPTKRKCPACNGKGTQHSPCAFGGSGDTYTCHVCDGLGQI